jgi:hypothetical protein
MHKRTFARAAGVSPPWFCKPRLQRQCAELPRFDSRCAVHSTGGLRPPLLALLQRPSAGITTIFPMHKRTPKKSGGRQPAVVRDMNAVPWKSSNVRELANTRSSTPRGAYDDRSRLHVRTPLQKGDSRPPERYLSHGGLTPPALGAVTTTVCRNNDDFSDAQTHAQKERRASARRGARHRRCAVRDEHCSAATEPTNKSGGRQPAVVGDTSAVL